MEGLKLNDISERGPWSLSSPLQLKLCYLLLFLLPWIYFSLSMEK